MYQIDKNQLRAGGKAFFTAWAILRVCGLGAGSVLSVVLLIGAYYLYWRKPKESRRAAAAAAGIAGILTILWIMGETQSITAGLDNQLFRGVILAAAALGLFFLLQAMLAWLYDSLQQPRKAAEAGGGHTFSLTAAVCMVCWLPYLLANFPAVMTIDSFNQYAQTIGVYAYSNHHPWIHTMLLKLCTRIGGLFTQDASAAIVVYTLLQMLFMACCAGYLTDTMKRVGISGRWIVAVLLFYALLPFQGMFAVTLWKDVMFAGFFLLFSTALFRMLSHRKNKTMGLPVQECAVYAVSGCMVSLLRSNGWYAFLATVPFCLFFFRKQIRLLLLLNCLVIFIVMLVKGPVMTAYGVIQPDLAESLSIPLQQIARVVVRERGMTQEQEALLTQIMELEEIAEVYDPGCSDPIKRLVRKKDQDALMAHWEEYRKLYLSLGLQYPMDYFDAWADQTSGYWFPRSDTNFILNEGIPENEFGLEGSSLFRGSFYIKCKEIYFKLYQLLPFLALFYSVGAYTWLMLIGSGGCIAAKRYEQLAVYLPGFALIGTLLLATPVNGEFRYAYAVVFTMPLYIMAMKVEN